MKAGSTVLAVLVLGLATLACQAPAQEAGPLSEEDVAAIRASTDGFTQAVLAGDAAAVAAFRSEDAVLMPPNEPALEGRAAIQAWNEAQAALGTLTEATFTPVQIDGRGYEECLAACQPHPDTLLFVARDGSCRQTESVV